MAGPLSVKGESAPVALARDFATFSGRRRIQPTSGQADGALAVDSANVPYNPNATSSSWQQFTLNGTAGTSGSVRVRFDGNSSSTARGAPGLDNVVLDYADGAVPEPSTWAMMIMGFGLVGGALRRKTGRLATA